ncbi:MAG TPA: hypothetical protein VK604_26095 [Bryobacteraceae bacterium]|nr:hypothetical protein [Bryobacteraceae bacterium]HTF65856.1 hypothetical protein [Edaphobacter sp.]
MANKNLRLDSRFSIIGAFWSPETPDTIMKGPLVSDEREINFITAPEYERPILTGPGTFAMPHSTMVPALHDFTQDRLFTLYQLVEQLGPSSTNFAVGQAIKAKSSKFCPVRAECTSRESTTNASPRPEIPSMARAGGFREIRNVHPAEHLAGLGRKREQCRP